MKDRNVRRDPRISMVVIGADVLVKNAGREMRYVSERFFERAFPFLGD